MFSNQKLKLLGRYIELKTYQNAIEYGYTNKKQNSFPTHKDDKTRDFSRQISSYRTKRRIRDLVYTNAGNWKDESGRPYKPLFVTLTFAENITDTNQANKRFTSFARSFSDSCFGRVQGRAIKYLNVVEFQKRGAIHYHSVMFNIPFIEQIYDRINASWGHGFTLIESVNSIDHLANYVAKYVSKEDRDERLDGKKAFFTSRGLLQPKEFRSPRDIEPILAQIPSDTKKIEMEYTDYSGSKIEYVRWSLNSVLQFNI
jgi:hypothetical protein